MRIVTASYPDFKTIVTEKQAHQAYRKAAKLAFGEFARME